MRAGRPVGPRPAKRRYVVVTGTPTLGTFCFLSLEGAQGRKVPDDVSRERSRILPTNLYNRPPGQPTNSKKENGGLSSGDYKIRMKNPESSRGLLPSLAYGSQDP